LQLEELERRVAVLERMPFCAAARGNTPPGSINSLTLFTAPGYREAFRVLSGLSRGLHVAAGVVNLSTKDLHALYEYWAFVTVVRIVAEELVQPFPSDMLSTSVDGLRTTLKVGNKRVISFQHSQDRTVRVAYKPKLRGDAYLVAQEPDILISVEDSGWPLMTFVLDAKYRLDQSEQYALNYGYPGPPEDALNVLHRYRDAILHQVRGPNPYNPRLMHTVVEAAALYPAPTEQRGDYIQSKLYQAFDTIGVGAIPLLPGSTDTLRIWLRRAFRRGGWTTADTVVPHSMREQAGVLHRFSFERILVGVLRGNNPEEHLDWITSTGQYYIPASADARLQFSARGVAIYTQPPLAIPGAITHFAEVTNIEMKPRGEIPTPWQGKGPDELMVVYHLGNLQKIRPIQNIDPAVRFSVHRWTSRLAITRAIKVAELSLETEAEWRLYEDLTANRISVRLQAGRVWAAGGFGRAQMVLPEGTLVDGGENGFALKTTAGTLHFASTQEVIAYLRQARQE
jgi:hypothetical protein